jgi:hypothetical protein
MISGLLFAAAGAGLAAALHRVSTAKKRQGDQRAFLAFAVIPAALVVLCLLLAAASGRFGELRLTLDSVLVRPSAEAFSIGGGEASAYRVEAGRAEAADDIVVEGLQPGLVSLQVEDTTATARIAAPLPGVTTSLVALGAGQRADIQGAREIAPGDAFCLSNCERADAKWLRLDDGAVLREGRSGGKVVAKLPQRRVLRRFEGIAFWPAAQAIHPLPVGASADAVKGFLYQKGGLGGGDWRIVLLSPDAALVRGAGAPEPAGPQPQALPVPGDEGLHLSLWEARFYDPAAREPDEPAGRLVERRSLRLRHDGEALRLGFDTPERRVVGSCPRNGQLSAIDRIVGRGREPSGAVTFPTLGSRLADVAAGRLPLPPSEDCAGFRNARFALPGDAEAPLQASFVLERLAFPWPVLAIAAGWAWLSFAAQAQLYGADRIARSLFSGLQFLLAVRLLIALSGAAADPALPPVVLTDAALAYVVGPSLFLLAAPGRKGLGSVWLSLGLFVAATLAAVVLWTGDRPGGLTLALTAAAMGGVAWRALGVPTPSLTWPRLPQVKGPLWLWILGGAALARLVLGLLGVKERLVVAVSAFYTPALIVGFALMLAEALRRADAEPRDDRALLRSGIVFSAMAALMFGLPALVNDNGYVIVALPFLALPAWWALAPRPPKSAPRPAWSARLAWSAGALAVVGGLGVLLLGALVTGALGRESGVDPSRLTDPELLRLVEGHMRHDQNWLRIYLLLDPTIPASAGTAEAENLRAWSVYLSEYTGSALGRGYLSPANLGPILGPVHLNDNVSAVHLMSPFGRLGAAVFLLFLAALATAALRLTRNPGIPRDWPSLAGLLSLWILFAVAAYVILANLQLTPFTGRNVYLLAPASDSDLLEGLTLFAFAWWGLVMRREAHDGQP